MEKPKLQAHGLTQEQMVDLQYKQMHNEVEYVPANNAEEIKDKYFKEFEGHQIPEHEKHIYHVVSETRFFNQQSGEKTSTPVVNTFTKEAFEFHKKHNGFAGQTVHLLHNPELNNIKAKEEKKQADPDPDDGDLDDLTVVDLKAKYLELSGKDAPKGIKKDDLIDLINDL
jgi:hypothetical protein